MGGVVALPGVIVESIDAKLVGVVSTGSRVAGSAGTVIADEATGAERGLVVALDSLDSPPQDVTQPKMTTNKTPPTNFTEAKDTRAPD